MEKEERGTAPYISIFIQIQALFVLMYRNCFRYNLMRETQEDYYLVLFTFASQLYFYVLGPISLLGY